MTQPVYCAIGDIHGELDRLQELHAMVRFHAKVELGGAEVTLVHLGDLMDRGQGSCGVVDYLMGMEANRGPHCVNIRGNHEQLMIESVRMEDEASRRSWLEWGGQETMDSYRRRAWTARRIITSTGC
jgi:serine/threonine protein phosphatase 1